MQSNQGPHPGVGHPQTGGISQPQRSSSRRKGSEPPLQAPHFGKIGPQNVWLWKPDGLTFERTGESVNRDSVLRVCTQNLTQSESQWRGSSLKGTWVRPTCWSWRVSWRGIVQLGLLGMETPVAVILGLLFYHADTGTGKHHFASLPLTYQHQGLACQWVHGSHTILGHPWKMGMLS